MKNRVNIEERIGRIGRVLRLIEMCSNWVRRWCKGNGIIAGRKSGGIVGIIAGKLGGSLWGIIEGNGRGIGAMRKWRIGVRIEKMLKVGLYN